MSRGRITQIVNNANFGEINNLLSQGRDMEYIARHYNMDLPLVWALRLEGKTDQEKFKELGWGLRTWDQWKFNKCDERFGDDWPGRIPAQLIAHTLFYFTKPGDLVLDPTRPPRLRESNGGQVAGGGVVSDVCLLFERKCQSFDLAVKDNRPEILYHHWDPRSWKWPITKKPDLIFFDPPASPEGEADGGQVHPITSKKRRHTVKKQMRKLLQSHPIQRRNMRNFLKAFSCSPIKTQNQRLTWPS